MADSARRRPIAVSPAFTEHHPAVPAVLSFVSAFVDVTCFVGLFGTFTAFITGSVIVLASEAFHPSGHPWIRVTVLIVFVAAVMASFLAIRTLRRSGHATIRICLVTESVLILLFMASALMLTPRDALLSPGTTLAVLFATLAMGLQNTLMVVLLPFHKPTTIMTGNSVRLIVALTARRFANAGEPDKQDEVPPPDTQWTLLAFVAGALVGGTCIVFIGFWGLIIPVVALAAISARLPASPAPP